MKLPGFLNVMRLEGRIVAVFLSLLLLVQLGSFAVIDRVITRNADANIAAELRTGERIFQRLLAQQAERRRDAAALLAQDFGFKQAIALPLAETGTVETIQDALVNQGQRIGATVVAYFDNDLKLVAATRADAGHFAELLRRRMHAPSRTDDDAQLFQLDGHAYQVVVQPVRTPAPLGWVMLGFELDATTLQELKSLSEMQGLLLRRQGTNAVWEPLLSTQPANEAAAKQVNEPGTLIPIVLDGERWRGHLVVLRQQADFTIGVLLLRSFDAAIAPFHSLQLFLLGLTGIGVAVFAGLSIVVARRISEPLQSLAESAARLGRGDYDTAITRRHSRAEIGEVGDLASAFEAMRRGIRTQTAKVDRLAYWDELTGLPNRAQFIARLEVRLAEDQSCVVLILDLDRFKHVNDILGHEFGDNLLKGVGGRLAALSHSHSALLARLAGDEFALLLEPGADVHEAEKIARAIAQDFEHPILLDGQTVDLGAGIGIACSPEHANEAQELMVRAELAMYAAKQQQSGWRVYSSELDVGSQESLSLLSELRRAIDQGELQLYLQPKVGLQTGHVSGAEALVRWRHPERGLVPPMQFIPFAERTGFIRALTTWVIAEAAKLAREAIDEGLHLRISVNLSTRDLMDVQLPQMINEVVQKAGITADALCLEITESSIMDDPQRALNTLQQISALGFKLSIDDFGTGYSSLAYLKRLPVDELKIDRSFVMAMENDIDDARIVRSTIELAHSLGLTVVAEGVETDVGLQLLKRLGCEEAQGYFIGKPMPQAEFLHWTRAWEVPDLASTLGDTVLQNLDH
ncbi:putative bifunctional diguanylate cyclase/phosphodiesterase [Burkholderiaceae bacterium UC74_6]